MKRWKMQKSRTKGLIAIVGIWLFGAVFDRIWFAIDRSIPGWDQADYLNGALTYWRVLQTAQVFSVQWWVELWQLSTKIPPLVYISTTPFLAIFGTGPDQSTLVNLLYSAIVLGSVYRLGTYLFSITVGLWAAGLCVLMPALTVVRLDYLLDYPLAALVTLCFTCLTLWRGARWQRVTSQSHQLSSANTAPVSQNNEKVSGKRVSVALRSPGRWQSSAHEWLLVVATGMTLGLALMVKQPALFFLLLPLLWSLVEILKQRDWRGLLQGVLLLVIAIAVFYPWYRTNWLLILTAGKRATVDSAIAEGDPSLLSIQAWIYYLKYLPDMVSWPPLLVAGCGFLSFGWRAWRRRQAKDSDVPVQPEQRPRDNDDRRSVIWLLVFLVGGYLLSSLNVNKDLRYAIPYLPVLAVLLAYGFSLLPRMFRGLRWAAVGLTAVLLIANLFPIVPVAVRQQWSPLYQHQVYVGPAFPHAQVVAAVAEAQPYQRSTVGVVPSTFEVNQHNINYYGQLRQGQVHGRQVGTRDQFIEQDVRSLPWFVTKTANQGAIREPERQAALIQRVTQGGDFRLYKTWQLPDQTALQLWQRSRSDFEIKPLPTGLKLDAPVRLEEVDVPAVAPPGKPTPVTYRWVGNWDALQSGLVILTWRQVDASAGQATSRWLHDHAIAMGNLADQPLGVKATDAFEVTENLAMLPPDSLPAGSYTLEATYLNRQTGESAPIAVPPMTLNIDPKAAPLPAPEVDLVTQLRTLAVAMPQGMQVMEHIFDEIGRISQYDPDQDYVHQTRQAMAYRLQSEPNNRVFAYTLVLANVLKQQVQPAITALQRVVELDPQNPYAYAYLAVVNLYDFRPGAAQSALNAALKLDATIPELYGLQAIAGLMRGNLIQAWHNGQAYQNQLKQAS